MLANVPTVAETHFERAGDLCDQLYEIRKDGEGEEILTYRTMIISGQRELHAEVKQWKMEQGIYTSGSKEN